MSQNAQQLSLTAIAEATELAPLAEQEISSEVLVEKYAKGAETNVHDVRRRVARALAANEEEKHRAKWEERFLWAQENGFVPAGRINSAAGTPLAATLINCFVQPVGDSIVEMVDGRGVVKILPGDERLNYKPCVDITFGSAAKSYNDKVLDCINIIAE